jgi:formylmethanofuran:tetrahydromethanopterin formyltransferase
MPCITHYHACDCREAQFAAARAVVEAVRSLDKFSPFPRGGYTGGQSVQSQSAYELARDVARKLTAYDAATK